MINSYYSKDVILECCNVIIEKGKQVYDLMASSIAI